MAVEVDKRDVVILTILTILFIIVGGGAYYLGKSSQPEAAPESPIVEAQPATKEETIAKAIVETPQEVAAVEQATEPKASESVAEKVEEAKTETTAEAPTETATATAETAEMDADKAATALSAFVSEATSEAASETTSDTDNTASKQTEAQTVKETKAADSTYVQALDALQDKTAEAEAIPEKTDRQNKVEVTETASTEDNSENAALKSQLANAIGELVAMQQRLAALEEKLANPEEKKPATSRENLLVAALQSEAKQHESESRTIEVLPGDSLWLIAARVYGTGFDYHRIQAANPEIIKNPNLIEAGQVLRVPL